MQTIPIITAPNQELSVTIGQNRWVLRIKQAVECMFADITLNDAVLLSGQRIAVGTPIIPYEYLSGSGNFLLLVDGEDLPDWEQFGISQQLVYVSPEELA